MSRKNTQLSGKSAVPSMTKKSSDFVLTTAGGIAYYPAFKQFQEDILEEQEVLDLALAEQQAHDEAALRELSFISELELTCQDCIQGSLRICGEHCTVVV